MGVEKVTSIGGMRLSTYGNGGFLQWLADRKITPYMRTRDSIHRKNSPFFGPERFIYQPASNSYR